jgi:hypothetical protein
MTYADDAEPSADIAAARKDDAEQSPEAEGGLEVSSAHSG